MPNPEKIITSTEYSETGNFVSKTTDALGNDTDYDYNEQTGTLTSVTDPKGNLTSYTYENYTNAVKTVTSGGTTVSYDYENDRLKTINASGNVYGFTYDQHGRRIDVKIGNKVLSTTSYNDKNLVARLRYGNGNTIDYYYDNLDRITSRVYNENANKSVKYLYGNTGLLSNVIDLFKNTRTKYIYDLSNRLVGVREYSGTQLNGNNLVSYVKYNYEDKTNRLSSVVRNSVLGTQETGYVYGNLTAQQNPDAVYTVKHNGSPVLNYTYDALGRLSTRTIAPINKTMTFTYKQGGHGADSTSAMVETVTVDGQTKRYTYDANGNIVMVQTNNALECQYGYNSKNELVSYEIQEGINTYDYDIRGNITRVVLWDDTVKNFSYTDTNWPDKLTAVNGNTITYDDIGNPTVYYDNKLMAWSNGRQLVRVLDNDVEYNYAYDSDGLRMYKEIDCTTTQFHYADGVLLGQTTEDDTLIFLYDESGNKYGFIYNGVNYYYDINLQGDVVGIYNSDGTKVVTYEYDPWGNILSISGSLRDTIGAINPIRYRGYYYDEETGFYYLQSRYYDPEICRFINADGYVSTGQGVLGYNMFAYCNNNPVNLTDSTGEVAFWAILGIGALAVGLLTLSGCSDRTTSKAPSTSSTPSKPDNKPTINAEIQQLKDNPNKLIYNTDNSTTYAGETDVSVIARMLYGEDHNSIAGHLWVLENRRIAGSYGGSNFRSLILHPKQFSCMPTARSLDPAAHFNSYGEKMAWDECVDMAYLYTTQGISAIPKPSASFPYTYTYTYSSHIQNKYPNGVKIGGTWFYCK